MEGKPQEDAKTREERKSDAEIRASPVQKQGSRKFSRRRPRDMENGS